MNTQKVKKNIFEEDETTEQTTSKDTKAEKRLQTGSEEWAALNLKETLQRGIFQVGFETPSSIQKKAIPHIISGKDMRAQAQSGTGKTGAFVIGCLQRLDENLQATQVLVLASTREIAYQNALKFNEIGSQMNIRVSLSVGGMSSYPGFVALDRDPHVVVGTTGRVKSMIESKKLNTENIKIFVLDEADEMLKASGIEDVREIYQGIIASKFQTLLFSATYSENDLAEIKNIISDDAIEIDVRTEELTLVGIQQYYVSIGKTSYASMQARDQEVYLKVSTLMDIFKNKTLAQVLIFINRRSHAAMVYDILNKGGYPCELMSSDLEQRDRNRVLEGFKNGKIRILVSSGLCKRGIDVQSLSLVVCLDVPGEEDKNDYIHRVGRSGRFGRKGIAIHILSENEVESLKEIVNSFQGVIVPLPEGMNLG